MLLGCWLISNQQACVRDQRPGVGQGELLSLAPALADLAVLLLSEPESTEEDGPELGLMGGRGGSLIDFGGMWGGAGQAAPDPSGLGWLALREEWGQDDREGKQWR